MLKRIAVFTIISILLICMVTACADSEISPVTSPYTPLPYPPSHSNATLPEYIDLYTPSSDTPTKPYASSEYGPETYADITEDIIANFFDPIEAPFSDDIIEVLDQIALNMLLGNLEDVAMLLESKIETLHLTIDTYAPDNFFIYRDIFRFSSYPRLDYLSVSLNNIHDGSGIYEVVSIQESVIYSDSWAWLIRTIPYVGGLPNGMYEVHRFSGGILYLTTSVPVVDGVYHGEHVSTASGFVITQRYTDGILQSIGPPDEHGNIPTGVIAFGVQWMDDYVVYNPPSHHEFINPQSVENISHVAQ